MGVRGERMHYPPPNTKEEEEIGGRTGMCRGAPSRSEMDIWTCCLAMFPKVPQEGSRARSRERSHVAIMSQLPTGQIPWGLLSRWPACPILFELTLPQPLECISCRLPGGPICWPHLSWQPFP